MAAQEVIKMFSDEWYDALREQQRLAKEKAEQEALDAEVRALISQENYQERLEESIARGNTGYSANTSIRFTIGPDGRPVYLFPSPGELDREVSLEEAAIAGLRQAKDVEMEEELSYFAKIVIAILGVVLVTQVSASLAMILPQFIKRNPFIQNIYGFLKRMEPTLERMKRSIDTERARIRGILDSRVVSTSLRTLNLLHRTGLQFSGAYREKVEGVYRETRKVSRTVLGEATEISSALGLLRLAIADATALGGREADIGQHKWFTESIRLTEFVEDHASTYARRPEEFWGDFNTFFLDPVLEEARRENRTQRGLIDDLVAGVDIADRATKAVADRFDEYTEELSTFLTPPMLRSLTSITRDFGTRVRIPLRNLALFTAQEWPKIELKVSAIETVVNRQQEEINIVTEITKDPDELDDEAQDRQTTRFARILGNGLPSDLPTDPLGSAIVEVRRIQRELPEN